MKTLFKERALSLLLFALFSCGDDDDKPAERKLPEFMKFTGEAGGVDDGITVNCLCDLNLELPEVIMTEQGSQKYTGFLGGEITRAVTNDDGNGFAFAPFLYGQIDLVVKANDSIYLSWPGNEGTGIPFYDEIALFKGKLNRDDGTVTGSWKCAPLDLEEGGYVDLHGIAEGTWGLEEFE